MNKKLTLDDRTIQDCRNFASSVADEILSLIDGHTTVTVERTIARFLDIDGVNSQGVPLPNVITDQLVSAGKLPDGAYYRLGCIAAATGKTPREIAYDLGQGNYLLDDFPDRPAQEVNAVMAAYVNQGISRIDLARESRANLKQQYTP